RPLALGRTFLSADEAITYRVAAPHASKATPPRVLRRAGWQPGWQLARADVPIGGPISSGGAPSAPAPAPPRDAGAEPPGGPPVSRATLAEMQAPLAQAGCFADEVGVAWMLRQIEGRRLVTHGGLTTGYATAFTLVPDADAAIIVLANATPGGTWL